MSLPKESSPAKLVVGLFTARKALFERVAVEFVPDFYDIDMVSPWLMFGHTDYYVEEMGPQLFRRFIVFSRLINPDQLAEIKLFSNDVEGRYSKKGKRLVNIDPGYVVAERFVLATGKNYTHRIYLQKGIYADLTLIFQKGDFRPLPWTYPDYAGKEIRVFLRDVRKRYLYQLKGQRRT